MNRPIRYQPDRHYSSDKRAKGTNGPQCTETKGVPYVSGAKVQPITIHGEHADDAGGTGVVGDVLA